MGEIISSKQYLGQEQYRYLKPIIYCNPSEELKETAVSLNLLLAEKISKIKPSMRTMYLEQCVHGVIGTLPDNVVIRNFDVLFHPDYQVDVLKILIAVCKRKPFQIIWPGTYKDEKLYYAEEGYSDYKAYSIQEYDMTCVI